jgi:hypothetical protein
MIAEVLENLGNDDVIASVRRRVAELTERFPLYHWKLNAVAAN